MRCLWKKVCEVYSPSYTFYSRLALIYYVSLVTPDKAPEGKLCSISEGGVKSVVDSGQ